jgi:hypothetical protein
VLPSGTANARMGYLDRDGDGAVVDVPGSASPAGGPGRAATGGYGAGCAAPGQAAASAGTSVNSNPRKPSSSTSASWAR